MKRLARNLARLAAVLGSLGSVLTFLAGAISTPAPAAGDLRDVLVRLIADAGSALLAIFALP